MSAPVASIYAFFRSEDQLQQAGVQALGMG